MVPRVVSSDPTRAREHTRPRWATSRPPVARPMAPARLTSAPTARSSRGDRAHRSTTAARAEPRGTALAVSTLMGSRRSRIRTAPPAASASGRPHARARRRTAARGAAVGRGAGASASMPARPRPRHHSTRASRTTSAAHAPAVAAGSGEAARSRVSRPPTVRIMRKTADTSGARATAATRAGAATGRTPATRPARTRRREAPRRRREREAAAKPSTVKEAIVPLSMRATTPAMTTTMIVKLIRPPSWEMRDSRCVVIRGAERRAAAASRARTSVPSIPPRTAPSRDRASRWAARRRR